MVKSKLEDSMDRMFSYKHKHNGAVHIRGGGNFNITYDVKVRRRMTFATPAMATGLSRKEVKERGFIKRSRVRLLIEKMQGRR